jgi:oligogalacturonide lyase
MKPSTFLRVLCALGAVLLVASTASAQIGRRFPSEKKVVPDPVTGIPLTFLTSAPAGDSKIYPTHPQWTSDGQWLIFRSSRVPDEAMAVNEDSGVIVQVTEGGYMGMLCVARLSMKLYVMRAPDAPKLGPRPPMPGGPRPGAGPRQRPRFSVQIVEIDLATLFADSAAGTVKPPSAYERVCGTIPAEMNAGGDMALDANEDVAYFRFASPNLASRLPAGTNVAEPFGPRHMGAGPAGLARMNLVTGAITFIVAVPFQIGHVQTNPWVPGEIVFCWETGGKAPQRTWTVKADGSGLRPLYPEAPYEWITHEAVITKDEVAIAMLGHRGGTNVTVGQEPEWGHAGFRDHPTGVGVVNLRTNEMRIVGQVPVGDSGTSIWHVHGSADGRWAVADDFQYRLWLIDRHSGETILLSDNGHKRTAADHQHPTFSADGTKIEIQSAMLSEDGRSMNICIVPVPKSWLARTYPAKLVQ